MRLILAAALALAAAACPARAALVISNGATGNVSCASGVCTATAANAVLNEKDFRHMIGAGDLTLASGSAAQDIVVNAKIQWAKAHHLTLDSFRSIAFTLELASEGGGGATLTTNDGGSGGTLSFTAKGKLTFWDTSSSLTIDGRNYTIINDIATLAADIAASPYGAFALGRGYEASVDGVYKSAPIPTAFNGFFEGLGHAIDKLSISYKNKKTGVDLGLFQALTNSASVRDLTFTNPDIAYTSTNIYNNNTGVLAGLSGAQIENVAVIGGKVFGKCAGGLVGANYGVMTNTRVSGSVVGAGNGQYAGGLVCQNSSHIVQSFANASVGAGYAGYAGGLVSGNSGTISLSHAAGTVSVASPDTGNVQDEYAGGLVANNNGTISQSYSTAAVDGGTCYGGAARSTKSGGGGLVGYNFFATISDSYATGPASAGQDRLCNALVGGLIAYNAPDTAIQRVYSTGLVTCRDCGGDGLNWGGLIGVDGPASDQSAYWDLDTSGISSPSQGAGQPANDPGLTGLSDAALKSELPAGFDPSVWAESPSINNGYPYLIANPPQ
jgi:hypothetical protein